MIDSVNAVATIVVALALAACGDEDERSARLQERSQPIEPKESPGKTADPGKTGEATKAEAGAKAEEKAEAPKPTGPTTALRLRLAEGTRYRNTTVAMVALPMVNKPVGYAREEELELSACKGEDDARTCALRHRILKFEAEPPTGKLFEQDEARVKELVTTHELTASGTRGATTAIKIEGTPGDPALAPELAEVHRFYCVRLPAEPVAVGATWKDECATWTGGGLLRRDVTWTLKSVDDDPISGKRAELRAVGTVTTGAGDKMRTGTIESILYFFVDKGEPHLLRERIAVAASAASALQTITTLNIQLAHVVAGDKTARTDGQPFPPPAKGADEGAAGAAGAAAPAGTTDTPPPAR